MKTLLIVIATAGMALSAQASHDPTKYDCREIVGYKVIPRTKPPVIRQPVWECPHKDKMAAGKCRTHWLFGMRCTE